MNFALVHLMVNQVPLWGATFAAVLFLCAALTIERENWVHAGLVILSISVFGAIAAFLSGVPAVDAVMSAPRASGKALSQHYLRATMASGFVLLSAVAGTTAFLHGRGRDEPFSRRTIVVLMVTSAIQALVIAWTAQAGGRINHLELQEAQDLQQGLAPPAEPTIVHTETRDASTTE
ncbi:MAG TPA: hypothetical protein VHB79_25025 [Polyangiaceae bacterium]|nr:hypothetical protein [Polyangiaceae bacterium]